MSLDSNHGGEFGRLKVANDDSTTARDTIINAWGETKPAIVFGRWNITHPSGAKQMLIWDKGELTGMGDLNIPFKPSHESIFILGKWPKPKPGVKRIGGVIKAPAPQPSKSQGRFHPTEKPTSLMELLIGQCPPGVIVDPFAGGGSTLRAAKNQGRKAIGFEIEERYCETIAKRLAQENLF